MAWRTWCGRWVGIDVWGRVEGRVTGLQGFRRERPGHGRRREEA